MLEGVPRPQLARTVVLCVERSRHTQVLAKPIAWVVGDQGGKQLVFYGVRAVLGTVSAASEVRARSPLALPNRTHHALRLAHALASRALRWMRLCWGVWVATWSSGVDGGRNSEACWGLACTAGVPVRGDKRRCESKGGHVSVGAAGLLHRHVRCVHRTASLLIHHVRPPLPLTNQLPHPLGFTHAASRSRRWLAVEAKSTGARGTDTVNDSRGSSSGATAAPPPYLDLPAPNSQSPRNRGGDGRRDAYDVVSAAGTPSPPPPPPCCAGTTTW